MKGRTTARWTSCALLWLVACGGAPEESVEVPVTTLVARDTVVTTSSELIGGVLDLAVAPDGRLYLSDFQSNEILSVRPDGTDPRTIGRDGSGPGEFRMPWSIAVSADSLWVYDLRNGRVQVFHRSGAYVRQYAATLPQTGRGRTFNADGELAAATGGQDSALVAVYGSTGARKRTLGEPIVPPTMMFDFGRIREQILAGEIPDAYRNDALPVWDHDGSMFVAFYAEPEVRRYGSDGTLVWTRTLDDPVLESARAAFVRKNRENTNPARLYTLRYVVDGQAVDGDLWLLLDTETEDDGVILVLDGADGSIERRVVLSGLSGAGQLAVDPARDRLYASVPDAAMLVAFPL